MLSSRQLNGPMMEPFISCIGTRIFCGVFARPSARAIPPASLAEKLDDGDRTLGGGKGNGGSLQTLSGGDVVIASVACGECPPLVVLYLPSL